MGEKKEKKDKEKKDKEKKEKKEEKATVRSAPDGSDKHYRTIKKIRISNFDACAANFIYMHVQQHVWPLKP